MTAPLPQVPEAVRRRPVGVFDSGVGGLTVLHELLVQLPAEDFVYVADSARFPYGARSGPELETFALEIAEELLARRRRPAVTKRTRYCVSLVVGLVADLVYGRISRDWSFGTFYAGTMGVVVVVGLICMFWTELAPDGDLRRTPPS